MKVAVVAVALLVLQVSLVSCVVEDLTQGSGMTTDESETTTEFDATTGETSTMECYKCGLYDDDMKAESECGVEKTTYDTEECPSGKCWIYKSTVSGTVTYARGCYNATDCADNTQEQCSTVGNKEVCKKCCSDSKCNSGKLELSSDAPKVALYLSTLVAAVATFLLL